MRHILKTFSLFLCAFFLTTCSSSNNHKTFRIGIDPSWYPLDLMGKEQNLLAFTEELFGEIAKISKFQFEMVLKSWDNLEEGLQKEEYQGMLSSIQPFVFYEKKYDFSHRFLHTGPVLVTSVNSTFHSLESLDHKEIAVMRGSAYAALVASQSAGVILRIYDSIPKALNDIVTGTVDGAVIDVLIANSYCNDIFKGKLKIATKPYTEQGLRVVALHEKNEELIEIFNSSLDKLIENDVYDNLTKKWNLDL